MKTGQVLYGSSGANIIGKIRPEMDELGCLDTEQELRLYKRL